MGGAFVGERGDGRAIWKFAGEERLSALHGALVNAAQHR
jgi:hypothetical protein